MLALIKSYQQEIEKIKKRGSVWLETPTGWFHTSDKDIIDLKVSILNDEIDRLQIKYNQ